MGVLINFRIPAELKKMLATEVESLSVCPNLSAYIRWIVENRFKIPELRRMHKVYNTHAKETEVQKGTKGINTE